jgi:ribosomal protein S25
MSRRSSEKKVGGIEYPDPNTEEVMGVLKRMRVITPTSLASNFNIKVSVAKKMIRDLEKQNKIKLEAHSSNLKVYSLISI